MGLRSKLNPKILSVVILTGGAIILLTLIFFFRTRTVAIPESFLSARGNAVTISKRITELTLATNEKIKEVNLSESTGKTGEALDLVEEARTKNTEAYNQAFELSRQLQKLAASLGDIPSNKSQRFAYEAVAVELSLVSEFISYTQNLNSFLDGLKKSIAAGTPEEQERLRRLVREINKNADTINALNKEFSSKMERFDNSL